MVAFILHLNANVNEVFSSIVSCIGVLNIFLITLHVLKENKTVHWTLQYLEKNPCRFCNATLGPKLH